MKSELEMLGVWWGYGGGLEAKITDMNMCNQHESDGVPDENEDSGSN